MRNAFIKKLTECAEKDERIVLLVGDLGYKIFDDFKEKFPNRFYNVGIAEQNMVSMASGMALEGYKPFVYSIAPFVTLRCAEQIRNDLCYNDKNVVIVGAGGGYTYGHNGPTHHTIEDIALLRAMPNIEIYCPGDPVETEWCVALLANKKKPAYLRIGRAGEKVIHNEKNPYIERGYFELNRPREGNIALLSTGNMLGVAVEAQKLLKEKGVVCSVISIPKVKPLSISYIEGIFVDFKYVFTLEEHNILGGFGSAVAECLAESGTSGVYFRRFGIEDHFAGVSGDQEYLRKLANIQPNQIADEINLTILSVEYEK